jgi:putative phage-type endonuclease
MTRARVKYTCDDLRRCISGSDEAGNFSTDLTKTQWLAKNCLGLAMFQTEVSQTPESHSEFEWVELASPKKVSEPPFLMPWDDESQFDFIVSLPSIDVNVFFDTFVKRTKAQCIEESKFEQRSIGWHRARAFCITASQFASAGGHSRYMSRPAYAKSKLHPHLHIPDSPFIQWGVEHEIHAKEAFEAFLTTRVKSLYRIDHPNLLKHEDIPWMACSPDGVLYRKDDEGNEIVELLEFKAPAYYRDKIGHPYSKEPFNIPRHYMDQIQGSMWLMRNHDVIQGGKSIERCWFVVWQPHACYVTHIPYLESYANELAETVHSFYRTEFEPKAIELLTTIQKANEYTKR